MYELKYIFNINIIILFVKATEVITIQATRGEYQANNGKEVG